MGPAQFNLYGLPKSQGSPSQIHQAADTGPYAIAAAQVGCGNYAWTHPLATSPSDSRQLITTGRRNARVTDVLTEPQAPGLGGSYAGPGVQPREAIGTARVSLSGVTGTANGNPFAFMPPPDKFLVLNLRKLAPVTRASANIGSPSLARTYAPKGNG